jgi:hypothetical protein
MQKFFFFKQNQKIKEKISYPKKKKKKKKMRPLLHLTVLLCSLGTLYATTDSVTNPEGIVIGEEVAMKKPSSHAIFGLGGGGLVALPDHPEDLLVANNPFKVNTRLGRPLGVQSGGIPDSALTASSIHGGDGYWYYYGPRNARLMGGHDWGGK